MTHRPWHVRASTSCAAPDGSPWPFDQRLTLTCPVKVSPLPIRRHSNTVVEVSSVWLLPARAAWDDTGVRRGGRFNRRTDRSTVGQRDISTQPPPLGSEGMELRAEEAGAFMYIVTTAGGKSPGRRRQMSAHSSPHHTL